MQWAERASLSVWKHIIGTHSWQNMSSTKLVTHALAGDNLASKYTAQVKSSVTRWLDYLYYENLPNSKSMLNILPKPK